MLQGKKDVLAKTAKKMEEVDAKLKEAKVKQEAGVVQQVNETSNHMEKKKCRLEKQKTTLDTTLAATVKELQATRKKADSPLVFFFQAEDGIRDPGARRRDRAGDRRVPQDRAHGAEGRARGAPGQ